MFIVGKDTSNLYTEYRPVGQNLSEGFTKGDISCIDSGSREYPSMGEEAYPLGVLSAYLFQEISEAVIFLPEGFTSGGGGVYPVVPPCLGAGVGLDFVPCLHFPVAEVELTQSVVGRGIGVSAIGSQSDTPAHWTGVDPVEGQSGELLLYLFGLLREGIAQGDIGLPVCRPARYLHRGMPYQIDFHHVRFNLKGASITMGSVRSPFGL